MPKPPTQPTLPNRAWTCNCAPFPISELFEGFYQLRKNLTFPEHEDFIRSEFWMASASNMRLQNEWSFSYRGNIAQWWWLFVDGQPNWVWALTRSFGDRNFNALPAGSTVPFTTTPRLLSTSSSISQQPMYLLEQAAHSHLRSLLQLPNIPVLLQLTQQTLSLRRSSSQSHHRFSSVSVIYSGRIEDGKLFWNGYWLWPVDGAHTNSPLSLLRSRICYG